TEVVVAEPSVRIGGAGGAERLLDPAVAELDLQVGLAATAAPLDLLVHNVPLGDLSPPVPGYSRDVVEHRPAQVVADQALDPARLLCVPDQCVAPHAHAVTLRVADDLVAAAEVELSPGGLGGVPLHRVFGYDAGELTAQSGRVGGVTGQARDHGRPEVSAALGRGRTKRVCLGHGGRGNRERGCHRHCGGRYGGDRWSPTASPARRSTVGHCYSFHMWFDPVLIGVGRGLTASRPTSTRSLSRSRSSTAGSAEVMALRPPRSRV